jgi:hypothetical protein
VYFQVRWEQLGPPSDTPQRNSTVALWRYNFGVVVSATGRNGFATDEAHRGAPSLGGGLVDPIDKACGEVERCQVPVL